MNGDLISRAKAIAMHNAECSGDCGCCKHITKDLECGILINVPAVDAVEVVRCKDCIHSKELPLLTRIGFVPGTMRCTLGRGTLVKGYSVVQPKEFCSGATKKMDGDADG